MMSMNNSVDIQSTASSEEEQWYTPPSSPVPDDLACPWTQPGSNLILHPERLLDQPEPGVFNTGNHELDTLSDSKDEVRKPEISAALVKELTTRIKHSQRQNPNGLGELAEEIDCDTDLSKLSSLPELGQEIRLVLQTLVVLAENYPTDLDFYERKSATQLRKKITSTIAESGILVEACKIVANTHKALHERTIEALEIRKRSSAINDIFRAFVLIQTHELFNEEMMQLWAQVEASVFSLAPHFWRMIAHAMTKVLCDRAVKISGKPLSYFRNCIRRLEVEPPVKSCGKCVIPPEAWNADADDDGFLNQLRESLAMPSSEDSPLGYLSRLNYDSMLEIMSNLHLPDLHQCSSVNRRMLQLCEASLPKATRALAENLTVYRTGMRKFYFQIEFRKQFYSMTLEDVMCYKCTACAVIPQKMRRIPPPTLSLSTDLHEESVKQDVTRAVSEIAAKILSHFDFASCHFYHTPLDAYLLDIIDTVSSSTTCTDLQLRNCWLSEESDSPNQKERFLDIIRVANPLHLRIEMKTRLYLNADFLTDYARSAPPDAKFSMSCSPFQRRDGRYQMAMPDWEFVSSLWKFASFDLYALIVNADWLVAPFCTRLRLTKDLGQWSFFISNRSPHLFALAVSQEPDMQVNFLDGGNSKFRVRDEATSCYVIVDTSPFDGQGMPLWQFNAKFYGDDQFNVPVLE